MSGAKTMNCFPFLSFVVYLALLVSHTAADSKAKWLKRLLLNLEQVLADERLGEREREFTLSMACIVLGQNGRAEQAIELVKQHPNRTEWGGLFLLIAASQSETDDVDGALRTVELIGNPGLRQNALVVVIARQAQRGDDDDALALLGRVSRASARQRALKLMIEARIERKSFAEASQLMDQLENSTTKNELARRIQRIREQPHPGDADYTDRMLALAKENEGTLNLGPDEELLRLTCEAEVAMHAKDSAAFTRTLDALKRRAAKLAEFERRGATVQIANLYYRAGDKDSARRSYENVLNSFLKSRTDHDFVRIFALESTFENLVDVMPANDVERWYVKLIEADTTDSSTTDLIAGIAKGIVHRNDFHGAVRLYEKCTSARQRFFVCVEVLGKLKNSK